MNLRILILVITSLPALNAQPAVTYRFSGGRLGDNLIAYCHGKWISYKYKIPLLYKPFPYSDQLMMHERELYHYSPELEKYFTRVHIFEEGQKKFPTQLAPDVLYLISYFPEVNEEFCAGNYPYFAVDWQDPVFLQELRSCIAPRTPLTQILDLPKDGISVAAHVRRGGGYDSAQEIFGAPLKFPPDSFYIEQISFIAKEFPDTKIYVYIFTDDPNPAAIAQKYQQAVNNPRVNFACRAQGNTFYSNVLEDFFALQQCDCLIRPESSMSIMAEKLGQHRLVIYPAHAMYHNNLAIIDVISIKRR